ncbi:hypothetical protein RIF29_16607 [Crotalaria pallida]|uniref:Uncharacterized protein n=1 Tax=Crotalaria pallida TaxID=3830 RepID=A0AAN9FMS5_CROPI
MMKKSSPEHPKYEASHYDDYGFDLQQDFSQFLKEAKQHGKEAKQKSSSSVYPEESRKGGSDKEKKGKKSWKSSLISWWKIDKKTKHREEHNNNNNKSCETKVISGKRQGGHHVSGPIYNCSSNGGDVKQWRPKSGPMTSLFKATKREESEIPYVSLNQQNNNSRAVHNYGPLYVVT